MMSLRTVHDPKRNCNKVRWKMEDGSGEAPDRTKNSKLMRTPKNPKIENLKSENQTTQKAKSIEQRVRVGE